MSFERIKRELLKDHEKARKEKKELFENGFLSSWNEDAKQNAKDNILRLLREYLTPSKWEKYQDKKITLKEAKKIAFNRFVAEDEKNCQKQLLKIENVENAEIPNYIRITIEWHKTLLGDIIQIALSFAILLTIQRGRLVVADTIKKVQAYATQHITIMQY